MATISPSFMPAASMRRARRARPARRLAPRRAHINVTWRSAAVNTCVETVLNDWLHLVARQHAGITRDGLLARMKDEDFDAVIDVNLKGTFNCCKAAAQRMMKQRYGRIVNMSSVVGVAGNAGQANYAASKAGVIGLTKSIARELAARNVTANAVAPGFIATDMTDALSEKQREAIVGRIASKRLGEPRTWRSSCASWPARTRATSPDRVVCIDGGMSL